MTTTQHLRQTIFLDRDGVINQDSPDYIKTREEFTFLPGSVEAIFRLYRNGFDIIVITNQSVINRKMTTPEELQAIFSKMKTGIEAGGGRIKDIFFCPHMPEDGCDCRKPLPGLIHQAIRKYDLNPAQAVMVGDSIKDILCGRAAGVGTGVLVMTGNGPKAQKELDRSGHTPPDYIARDLNDAATWIITHCSIPPAP